MTESGHNLPNLSPAAFADLAPPSGAPAENGIDAPAHSPATANTAEDMGSLLLSRDEMLNTCAEIDPRVPHQTLWRLLWKSHHLPVLPAHWLPDPDAPPNQQLFVGEGALTEQDALLNVAKLYHILSQDDAYDPLKRPYNLTGAHIQLLSELVNRLINPEPPLRVVQRRRQRSTSQFDPQQPRISLPSLKEASRNAPLRPPESARFPYLLSHEELVAAYLKLIGQRRSPAPTTIWNELKKAQMGEGAEQWRKSDDPRSPALFYPNSTEQNVTSYLDLFKLAATIRETFALHSGHSPYRGFPANIRAGKVDVLCRLINSWLSPPDPLEPAELIERYANSGAVSLEYLQVFDKILPYATLQSLVKYIYGDSVKADSRYVRPDLGTVFTLVEDYLVPHNESGDPESVAIPPAILGGVLQILSADSSYQEQVSQTSHKLAQLYARRATAAAAIARTTRAKPQSPAETE